VNPRRVRERESRTLTVEGENDVQLLERWLQELLYVTETEGLVFGRFEVTMSDGLAGGRTTCGEYVEKRPQRMVSFSGAAHMNDRTYDSSTCSVIRRCEPAPKRRAF
jgi:SHS2 domain-containing protein